MSIGSAPPFTLNDLLRLSGIAPEEVLVVRHRPTEAALNRRFEWLVAEREDLFDSYQGTHAARTEAALAKARYLISFIRHAPKTALFVGLFPVASFTPITVEQQLADPAHQELIALGLTGDTATRGRETLLRFDLPRSDWHADWRGRLIVRWPGLERSWYRWADRNEFVVEAIARASLLVQGMPDWDQLSIGWNDLALLPRGWRAKLAEWRGVYLITDTADRKQYIGSAFGSDNLLQRWSDYARSGHGGNKLLRDRTPADFRFSILQRVSPDLAEAEVIAVERSWKLRLLTLAPEGLNEN